MHSRDEDTWDTLEGMDVQHGEDCSPPPATHHSDSYAGAVHQCKDHVMTAINGGGYAAIYLTPGAMVRLSQGTATIKFDVSTARTSERDWIDLWVTPFAENLQLPLEDWLPDLQGPPRHALQIRMDNNEDSTFFRGELYDDYGEDKLPQATDAGYETVLAPSATTRTTFELDISRTHIRFGLPTRSLWWIDTDVPALSWGGGSAARAALVQPLKGVRLRRHVRAQYVALGQRKHQPGSAIRHRPRDQSIRQPRRRPRRHLVSSAAPPNSFLRFSAIGDVVVSFDAGHTWEDAVRQEQELSEPSHYSSFWMPIPAGTKSVQLRFSDDDWYDGPFRAQDFGIWTTPG